LWPIIVSFVVMLVLLSAFLHDCMHVSTHSDSDWGFYRGNSKMSKFQIFWAQMIDKVLIFDNSMPKDTWFQLNFNFLRLKLVVFANLHRF
jgi:hypothetical protein